MNILLIGFGNVGQGLVSILQTQAATLRQTYGFSPRIVGVATRSRGTLYDADGLAPDALLATAADFGAYPTTRGLRRDLDVLQLIQQAAVDVVIEASPSNLETGQPALDYSYAAFNAGKHLVCANKGPAVLDYLGLREAAKAANRELLIEATVMSGTPAIRTAQAALAGSGIQRVRGILNGTTNYILTQMERGMSYAAALAQAQAAGYAETDPTADVEGWDAAGKLVILSAVIFGVKLTFDQMKVAGISGITPDNVQAAKEDGECWKLIAEATPQGASVRPVRLPSSDPLAAIAGTNNAITYTTALLGDVTLIGAGAGGVETGFALLSDLLALHQRAQHA